MKRTATKLPDATDRMLFRDAVRDAVPLKESAPRVRRPAPTHVAPPSRQVQQPFIDAPFASYTPEPPLEPGERLQFLRGGMGPDVLKKLRRGAWPVGGELDLHGLTRAQAQNELLMFLQESRNRGARCVRVIHGKGLSSRGNTPVLKAGVKAWLAAYEDVLAFCEATARQGGSGAVLVLLRA
jgi:DNA-nicking Smr family endonuclease